MICQLSLPKHFRGTFCTFSWSNNLPSPQSYHVIFKRSLVFDGAVIMVLEYWQHFYLKIQSITNKQDQRGNNAQHNLLLTLWRECWKVLPPLWDHHKSCPPSESWRIQFINRVLLNPCLLSWKLPINLWKDEHKL